MCFLTSVAMVLVGKAKPDKLDILTKMASGDGPAVKPDTEMGMTHSSVHGGKMTTVDGNGLKSDVPCVPINNDNRPHL